MKNNDYAVVKILGRQMKVSEGQHVKSDYIKADAATTLSFSEVLMIKNGSDVRIGQPFIEGAQVTAEVVSHGREDKVLVFKYLRKNKSKKMHGHRQPFTTLAIKRIEG